MNFKPEELAFLERSYIARFASCDTEMKPHVSPVYYANEIDSIFFATEKKARKFKDILRNANASIAVDDFDADWLHGSHGSKTVSRAVIISGRAEIFESGEEHHRMYLKLFEKYPDYREENWPEGSYPIIRVMAEKTVSWGL